MNDEMTEAQAGPGMPAAPALQPEQHDLRLPLHVNARGLALGIIATVTFLYALQWAQRFLIPVFLGVVIAYTLNPLVVWLERVKLPRMLGATLVTALIFCGTAGVLNTMQGEFQSIVEELPAATHKLSHLLATTMDGQPSTFQKMQAVAAEFEEVTGGKAPSVINKGPTVADRRAINVLDWVWVGSMGLLEMLGQATMVIFLVYFLLLSGDTFKRKLVKLTGPSLAKKKITVHILDDINVSIQGYMFMLLVTNSLLALLMWFALRAIGLENAGAWAIVAGLVHIMPYFGPLMITGATGLVAFLQFESLEKVLLVMGSSMAIATLVGSVVTTWMTGKIARMNPAAVFVSLLFWGWLWGVWGLLLGVPIIFMLKVIAERVEGLEVIAELLGE